MIERTTPGGKSHNVIPILVLLILAPVSGYLVAAHSTLYLWGLGVAGTGMYLLARPIERRGVITLGFVALLLTAYPTARVMIGDMPLYLIDVLIAATILWTLESGGNPVDWKQLKPLPFLILLYIVLTGFSSLHEMQFTGVIWEPFYMLLRYGLSMSLALLVPRLVRTQQDVRYLVWMLLLGMSVTALTGFIQSLPLTNNPLRDEIIPWLVPNREIYTEKYLSSQGTIFRARTLVGAPTMMGHMIGLVWPLGLGMYLSKEFQHRRFWLITALVILLLGAVSTYARSAYLAIAFAIAVMLFSAYGESKSRFWFWMSLGLVFVFLSSGQWQSRYFEVIGEKFAGAIENPYANESDEARLLGYKFIPSFMAAYPESILIGQGVSAGKLSSRGLFSYTWKVELKMSNIWAMVLFQRGLVAAVVLTAITGICFRRVWRLRTNMLHERDEWEWLYQGLFLGFVALIPLWLVDHALTSGLQGQSLMFIYFGLSLFVFGHVGRSGGNPGTEESADLPRSATSPNLR